MIILKKKDFMKSKSILSVKNIKNITKFIRLDYLSSRLLEEKGQEILTLPMSSGLILLESKLL